MNLLELIRKIKDVNADLLEFIASSKWYSIRWWGQESGEALNDGRQEVIDLNEAHVLSSECAYGGEYVATHRPVLDIDLPVYVTPSSTPGHYHLFIDRKMTWTQYSKLLQVLGDVGILEPGYVEVSLKRGSTMVRLPWIKKEDTLPVKPEFPPLTNLVPGTRKYDPCTDSYNW